MKTRKRKQLESRGWKVGTAREFLGLNAQENVTVRPIRNDHDLEEATRRIGELWDRKDKASRDEVDVLSALVHAYEEIHYPIPRDPTRLPDNPVHPGAILRDEFLAPLGITQKRLAAHLRMSPQQLNNLIRGRCRVTVEMARLLSEALGTTPHFWVNLQTTYHLVTHRPRHHVRPIKPAS